MRRPGRGPEPVPAARARLGLRLREPLERGRGLRPLPAREDRPSLRREVARDRARRRLPAAEGRRIAEPPADPGADDRGLRPGDDARARRRGAVRLPAPARRPRRDDRHGLCARARTTSPRSSVGPTPTLAQAGGGRGWPSPEESFVQVLTPDGRLRGRNRGRRAPVAAPRGGAARCAAARSCSSARSPGIEGTARMLARPADGSADAAGRGRRASSLADREDTLSGLVTSFLIGGPIAVLLASAIGYRLATAGFAPVEAMRRRAKRISLDARRRAPAAAGRAGRDPPPRRDAQRDARPPRGVLRARAPVRGRRQPRAAHPARGAEDRAGGRAAHRSATTPRSRESLVAALEETDHLAQLAEDLLLIARAADGRLPVRREQVERRRAARADPAALRRPRARAGSRDPSRRARAIGSVSVDPLRARQALGNLVDNALRHGARRDPARPPGGDGEAIEIDVSDEGPGFPAELAPHAFERFARGDDARTRGGAGLGLAIVRAIAEAHGGDRDDRRHQLRGRHGSAALSAGRHAPNRRSRSQLALSRGP